MMIWVLRSFGIIFAFIGVAAVITCIISYILGRREARRELRNMRDAFDEDDVELYNKHLHENYGMSLIEIPEECDGCMFGERFVKDGDEDNILVCLRCKRTYVEGSECYEEYPDRYMKEEEENE